MRPDKPITTQPPTNQLKRGQPAKLPIDVQEVIEVIQENEYTCTYQVGEHYHCTARTVQCHNDFYAIRKALDDNRATFVERADLKLFNKLDTARAGAAEFALFIKRYGTQRDRDTLKSTTVIQTDDTDIVPLTDLE